MSAKKKKEMKNAEMTHVRQYCKQMWIIQAKKQKKKQNVASMRHNVATFLLYCLIRFLFSVIYKILTSLSNFS